MNDPIAPLLVTSSSRLVEFLRTRTADNLPAGVLQKARICLLDNLGCGLYGALTPWGKIAAEVVYEEHSQGRATVFGHRDPLAPARAALVNATAAHGFEIDDIAPGGVHPGAMSLPAGPATAEQFELPGIRMLLGLIAGYEATSRTAAGLGKNASQKRLGFHIPAITGVVGAAVATGVTLNLPHEQIMRAVGIACSSAAGILSFVQGTGGMVKRMHAGRAAESGVLACLLARRGFTAPLAAWDGQFGLLEVFGVDNANPQALDNQLGERFAISESWTKMYPVCGGLQAMTQALYALRVEHDIECTAIKKVRLGVKHRALMTHAEVAPADTMAAQYSMPFCAAVALVSDPKNPRSFIDDGLVDPAVCGLARRVELYLDPEMDAAVYPRNGGAYVEVHLTDGRTLATKIFDARGMPTDPCTEDEVIEKFRGLASAAITNDAIDDVLSIVSRIDTLPSVAPLSKVLRAGLRA